jgi:ATP-dependent DNA ligase
MVTYAVDEALEWFDVLPAAHGIEGLVIKPTSARYGAVLLGPRPSIATLGR